MKKLTIYHNPRCSKSRQTLEILQHLKLEPVVVDYLKTPLNLEQLKVLREQFSLEELVRSNEAAFQELGLSMENEAEVLQAMVKEPKLMQRPIVTYNGRAIIGRPPEKVLTLLGQ